MSTSTAEVKAKIADLWAVSGTNGPLVNELKQVLLMLCERIQDIEDEYKQHSHREFRGILFPPLPMYKPPSPLPPTEQL